MLLFLVVSYLVVWINLFADTTWCSGLGDMATTVCLWWYYHCGRLYLTIKSADTRPNLRDIKEILYVDIPRNTKSILISIMSMAQKIFVIARGGTSAAMFYNITLRFVLLI